MQHIVESIPGYSFIEVLGRGSQGIVCKVREDRTQRVVALKFARHGLLATESDKIRFEREIINHAKLEHPNIARVLSAGITDEGYAWFTSQFVEGRPLNEWLCESSEVLDISGRWNFSVFRKICEAVHYLHERGIVHRDLKPSNIIVDDRNEPFVIDFGLAKATARNDMTTLTGDGMMVGTTMFASPEQLRGKTADRRSDIYSLGVILYDWVVGRLPYECEGEDRSEIADAILRGRVVRPDQLAPGISNDLQSIILTCLEKNRDKRYATATALIDDIVRYEAGIPVRSARSSAISRLRGTLRRRRLIRASAVASGIAFACWLTVYGYTTVAAKSGKRPELLSVFVNRPAEMNVFTTSALKSLGGSIQRLLHNLRFQKLVAAEKEDLDPTYLASIMQPIVGRNEYMKLLGEIAAEAIQAAEQNNDERCVELIVALAIMAEGLDESTNVIADFMAKQTWNQAINAAQYLLHNSGDRPLPFLLEALRAMERPFENSVPALEKIRAQTLYVISLASVDGEIDPSIWTSHYPTSPELLPKAEDWPTPAEARSFVEQFFAAWIAQEEKNEPFDRTPFADQQSYKLIRHLPSWGKDVMDTRRQMQESRLTLIKELERRQAAARDN